MCRLRSLACCLRELGLAAHTVVELGASVARNSCASMRSPITRSPRSPSSISMHSSWNSAELEDSTLICTLELTGFSTSEIDACCSVQERRGGSRWTRQTSARRA